MLFRSLEKEIGRKITADELNSIRKIDGVKKEAAKAIQADLAKVISEQSGLKPAQVAPLLPKLGL